MKIRTIFFGTPAFAVPILEALVKHPQIELVLAVTQPDTPVGRKKTLSAPPVKVLAQAHNIPIFQPESLKNQSNQEIIKNVHPELIVLAAYGKIIPDSILKLPRLQSLNIHPSALPKYRGASPIQSVILAGEEKTAISIMIMEPTLDTGPIVAQKPIAIAPQITYPELEQQLALASAHLLSETLSDWIADKIIPQIQDHQLATYTKIFTKEDGQINWHKSAEEIDCQIRAFIPWPGTYTIYQNKRLKILKAIVKEKQLAPGEIELTPTEMLIGCQKNALSIITLQEEGKRVMQATDFIPGHGYLQGAKLV